MQQVRQQVKESWANMALGWQFLWELWAKSCWMWRSLTLNIVIQKWQPRTNTYLGPLVAEISHGGFRLLGRSCVVFCCWLSILKNTFILAAQREIFLKTEWLTPHAATENHSFCFITNWNVMLDTASLPGFLSGWYLSKRALNAIRWAQPALGTN